jgi:hypothetical protein
VYESSKQLVGTVGGNKFSIMASGALTGIASWVIICESFALSQRPQEENWLTECVADPIDSAKSVYQRNSLMYGKGEKVAPAPKIEWFKRSMYRGLMVSIGRSALVNAVFFSVLEFLKPRLQALGDDGGDSDGRL